jgi:uncharacterized protein YndB with AHSA1/START domain
MIRIPSTPAIPTSRSTTMAKTPLGFLLKLKLQHPEWFKASNRKQVHPMPWPAGFDPQKSGVFAHNEIIIPAPPSEVFKGLVEAKRWPEYLGNAGKIEGLTGAGPGGTLTLGSRYAWNFGERLKNEVTLFEQDRMIGWVAHGTGSTGFHRWILEPIPGGTRLITEEVQTGIVPRLAGRKINPMLHAGHQLWLESLKRHVQQSSTRDGWIA